MSIITLRRCDLAAVPTARHWMLTIGDENRHALRITRGRIDRHGRIHPWQPCIFLIVNGRRLRGE